MTKSRSLFSAGDTVVLDASVLINLDATSRAAEIVRAIDAQWKVVRAAYNEVVGRAPATRERRSVMKLVADGHLEVVELEEPGLRVYQELIVGKAPETLDDGEAATIAYAVQVSGLALLDEKKATRICATRFPQLRVATTVDALLDPRVVRAMSPGDHSEAVLRALQVGRMQVAPSRLPHVLALIGENAQHCPSLPRSARAGGRPPREGRS